MMEVDLVAVMASELERQEMLLDSMIDEGLSACGMDPLPKALMCLRPAGSLEPEPDDLTSDTMLGGW